MVAKDTSCGSETYRPYLDIERIINIQSANSITEWHYPVSIQKKFAEIYKTIEQLREQQTQSRQHIDNLFNGLMQQAFRGELTT